MKTKVSWMMMTKRLSDIVADKSCSLCKHEILMNEEFLAVNEENICIRCLSRPEIIRKNRNIVWDNTKHQNLKLIKG